MEEEEVGEVLWIVSTGKDSVVIAVSYVVGTYEISRNVCFSPRSMILLITYISTTRLPTMLDRVTRSIAVHADA